MDEAYTPQDIERELQDMCKPGVYGKMEITIIDGKIPQIQEVRTKKPKDKK